MELPSPKSSGSTFSMEDTKFEVNQQPLSTASPEFLQWTSFSSTMSAT